VQCPLQACDCVLLRVAVMGLSRSFKERRKERAKVKLALHQIVNLLVVIRLVDVCARKSLLMPRISHRPGGVHTGASLRREHITLCA